MPGGSVDDGSFRATHNAESVRPATRDRDSQAIQTLNYVPDPSRP